MRQSIFPVFVLCIVFLFVACHKQENERMLARLTRWDVLLDENPDAIIDSLELINAKELDARNRAYYGLLKTIAQDKTYADFTSDSLIANTVRYYDHHETGSENHIRSLVYRGIVLTRMGITDSTVYVPLIRAKELFDQSKDPNPSIGYLLYYYLGNLHYQNGNHDLARKYYDKALDYAKKENTQRHIFDAYSELFWNEMAQDRYETGKLYLDTLLNLKKHVPYIDFNILNMQSVYYDIQGEHEKALQCEKDMVGLLPFQKEKVDNFRTYYSLSDRYKSANKLDSAMYYGLQAIASISDSGYHLNYLLYKNVADIAAEQGNYKLADSLRQKMFEAYEHSVDEQTNTKILELEKRYDLAKAENQALKAQNNVTLLAVLMFLLLLSITGLILFFRKRQTMAALRNEKLQIETKIAETNALLLRKQTDQQKKILNIYGAFLRQYADQQHRLKMFEMKIRGDKNPKMADEYREILKQGEEQFNTLSNELFPSQIFEDILDVHQGLELLTETDRLLLIMLTMKIDAMQIASLLHTTPANLKSKKSYLKKKIMENKSSFDHFDNLISLFK
jgi:tetratricopeptide (TPR) repeat protein